LFIIVIVLSESVGPVPFSPDVAGALELGPVEGTPTLFPAHGLQMKMIFPAVYAPAVAIELSQAPINASKKLLDGIKASGVTLVPQREIDSMQEVLSPPLHPLVCRNICAQLLGILWLTVIADCYARSGG
jgi:hypothetical protein